MIMESLLTIIIPVYNTEKYLKRCLDSLIHPGVNVIIVNDGSTDNSKEILNKYCEEHKHFKVIHTPNRGAASARITGLKEVNTKYFSFVDSDDYINIKEYLNLVFDMESQKCKIGNGRMTVFLPNCFFPFCSRKWNKSFLDFSKDKAEFSNTTCSLLDKIFHADLLPLFITDSKQVVYEDMEVVYYVLAKNQYMLHTNNLIYNYCMRGLKNNSTSAIGLQITKSDGFKGLLSAASSMKTKFIESELYEDYKNELESIIIKLIYIRIGNILKSSQIVNKKEMAELAFQILNDFVPNWTSNPYFLNHFKKSEYNDYLFYLISEILKRVYSVNSNLKANTGYEQLLQEYDRRIIRKQIND